MKKIIGTKVRQMIVITATFLFALPMVALADLPRPDEDARHAAEIAGISGTESGSLLQLIGTLSSALFSVLAVILLLLMLYSGFLWLTAQGKEEQITKAKNILTAAVIGLIVILSGYAITVFFIIQVPRAALG
ncbi:hypothetical protein A2480_01050 [Candidatus Uhrbacteria bacterium RIFOXYC2_FULL_47_19]|uniref:Uncharacterized protein n=1 Tax=Candidatus Uhrbacteria bacterium RIFOXYC2_FULL_47_19 TaxID=1802424 RepID=A0A1F7WCX1_9BACT|nr:MAG: hypothetical protein A2480_01050 [Candidatus Uhrbacteria bacterium RIFOXYC2_FULL_47_19]